MTAYPQDRDAHYAHHLHRVVSTFTTEISGDNADLLTRILGNTTE